MRYKKVLIILAVFPAVLLNACFLTKHSEYSSNYSSSSIISNNHSSSSSGDWTDSYEVIETLSKRMPAEFEKQEMVTMSYPNNMPLSVYKTIAEDNKILVLTSSGDNGDSLIEQARDEFIEAGVNMDNVTFIDMELGSQYAHWERDYSPFYVFNDLDLGIVDFTYNRPARVDQNAVPSKLAPILNMPYSYMDLVHTGGNLMQDGRGTAFSDDLVIQENKNNEKKVRSLMKEYTGTDNYVITIDPQGDYIAHIDCWGKIVAPDKIIVAKLPKTNNRYSYYEQVAKELGNLKCCYGYNYKIYRIEEPGGDIAAPYTNSLIANNHVYMPLGENETYNQKALDVYREALPGYDIVGVEGADFIYDEDYGYYWGEFLNTDALHCRTHEIPDRNMLFIDSRDVFNGEVSLQDDYLIKTNVVSYAKEDIDKVEIHYSINGASYVTEDMNQFKETTNYTFFFSNLNNGDDVKYYITASDNGNNTSVDPTCGERDPHHFVINN